MVIFSSIWVPGFRGLGPNSVLRTADSNGCSKPPHECNFEFIFALYSNSKKHFRTKLILPSNQVRYRLIYMLQYWTHTYIYIYMDNLFQRNSLRILLANRKKLLLMTPLNDGSYWVCQTDELTNCLASQSREQQVDLVFTK
jgi:hypothetical protein